MTDTAVKIEALSKRYYIGALQQKQSLRSMLARSILAPIRRSSKLLRGQAAGAAELDKVIWALKDVSLEVKRGDLLGILGANGAGKSTLLKILARITVPTTGRIALYGRVGSLLEVGTGFHYELTGRENVYLNGSILGMPRSEIRRKFDEIVSFANVEQFIDTPVKHYSSGMRVRLAFSVAAHLDADILLVDEVLAVGDAAFQQRSLGKMETASQGGRTVLFVSHDMVMMQYLCPKSILLENGQITYFGDTSDAIRRYLGDAVQRGGERRYSRDGQETAASMPFIAHALRVRDQNRAVTERVSTLRPFYVEIEYELTREVADFKVGFTLNTGLGDLFATIWTPTVPSCPSGRYVSFCEIPPGLFDQVGLAIGVASATAGNEYYHDELEPLEFFMDGATQLTDFGQRMLYPKFQWTVESLTNGFTP